MCSLGWGKIFYLWILESLMKSWELFKGAMQEILSQPLLFYNKFELFIFFNWNTNNKKNSKVGQMLLQWENFSPANLAGEPGRLTAYGGELRSPASVSVTCPSWAHWHVFSLFMLDFILAFLSMSERDVISRRRAFCYFPSFNTNPSIIFLVCLDAEEFFREVASTVGCGMRSSAYWESFFFSRTNE